jgi:UDP-glucose 4-epimerase
MTRVALVTGVSRPLGVRVAARLAEDPAITRVIGMDAAVPRPGLCLPSGIEVVRARIGHPLVARILDQAGVDTVVHAAGNATEAAELAVSCDHARTLTRVVAVSSTDVYGAAPRDPAVFTEHFGPAAEVRRGPGRLAAEVERAMRGLARRHPEIAVTTMRLAATVGPGADSWLTRYLAPPVVPVPFGFDARLQVVHEDDVVEALVRILRSRVSGPVNVAGPGVVTLGQALRITRRLRLPLPVLPLVMPRSFAPVVRFGRVVDVTRLTREVGYQPRYTTVQALVAHAADAGAQQPGLAGLATAAVDGVQRLVGASVGATAGGS